MEGIAEVHVVLMDLHIQLVYSAGGVAACDKADAGVLLFFRQGAVDDDDLHMEAPFPFSFSGGYYIRYPGELQGGGCP